MPYGRSTLTGTNECETKSWTEMPLQQSITLLLGGGALSFSLQPGIILQHATSRPLLATAGPVVGHRYVLITLLYSFLASLMWQGIVHVNINFSWAPINTTKSSKVYGWHDIHHQGSFHTGQPFIYTYRLNYLHKLMLTYNRQATQLSGHSKLTSDVAGSRRFSAIA